MRNPLPLESHRTTRLLAWLRKAYPGFWFKVHGNAYQPRVIDIFGCCRGQTIAIEVKRPGNEPTARQKLTLHELSMAGAITMVAWETIEIAKNLSNLDLDKLSAAAYIEVVKNASATSAKQKEKYEMAAKKSSAPSTKSKGKKVEDELEDLDDLDDLDEEEEDDDVEDEDEDEDDEDEDEDEEDEDDDEPVPVKKSSKKSAPVKATKSKAKAEPTKKGRGNAGNLTPRRVAEGMVGAAVIADELDSDGRTIRVHLRKLGTEKSENGLYEWKPGSKAFKDIVKAVSKSMNAAAKEKASSK